MKGAMILLTVLVITAIAIIIFYNSNKDRCLINSECQWVITNCCSETSGASWECVNVKTYNETECPKFIICPNFLSPKPDSSCACESGECVME